MCAVRVTGVVSGAAASGGSRKTVLSRDLSRSTVLFFIMGDCTGHSTTSRRATRTLWDVQASTAARRSGGHAPMTRSENRDLIARRRVGSPTAGTSPDYRSASTSAGVAGSSVAARLARCAHTASSGSPGCEAGVRRWLRGSSQHPASRKYCSTISQRRLSSAYSQPRIALVGKHRLENVQTKGPPGRNTRATSTNTSMGLVR